MIYFRVLFFFFLKKEGLKMEIRTERIEDLAKKLGELKEHYQNTGELKFTGKTSQPLFTLFKAVRE